MHSCINEEIWKEVRGFPDYMVSSHGKVKSYKNGRERIMGVYLDTRGYAFVRLWLNGSKKAFLSHRLIAMHFIPNPEKKPNINHKNGNKTDNRVENLEWATQKENVIHAFKSNLCSDKTGVKNSNAKINEDIVRTIRAIKGKSISKIAREFNISWSCANSVIKGKSWNHVS